MRFAAPLIIRGYGIILGAAESGEFCVFQGNRSRPKIDLLYILAINRGIVQNFNDGNINQRNVCNLLK